MCHVFACWFIDMGILSAKSLEYIVYYRCREETDKHAKQYIKGIMNAEIETGIAYGECPKNHESGQSVASEKVDDEESECPMVSSVGGRTAELASPIAVDDMYHIDDRAAEIGWPQSSDPWS